MNRIARCAECGFEGEWFVEITSARWFIPNEHDDGIVDICKPCQLAFPEDGE